MAVKVHWMEHEPNSRELEYHFTGLSTDEKPNSKRVAVNSLFLELDTGDFYYLKSQGGSSTTREDILQSTSVVCNNPYITSYRGIISDLFFENTKICVVFDGEKYTLNRSAYWQDGGTYARYGEWEGDSPLYESYPFAIETISENYEATYIYVSAEGTHTIEIYTEETVVTEAVWEKIGGGGSGPEPTGELLFNGSITTEEDGGDYIYAFDQNSLLLNYSSIIVELDGTRYTLERLSGSPDSIFAFGDDDDFSTYPLFLENIIQVGGSVWDTDLYTAEEKTYSLKIWANSDPVEPSWVPN